ncbi:MAG TPA: L,D-transpeptidase family protein [Thermodesulfobacteriota bacterium]|nr:L,D-transpeptidase family protein [Thermodesulfobacteriota bacterium]
MGEIRRWIFLFLCFAIIPVSISGCGHFNKARQAESTLKEANNLFRQGNYDASLAKYREVIDQYPPAADKVFFEMGIIYAHPGNEKKDHQKALECFQRIIEAYPRSGYRKDSEMMVFQITNVISKDKTISAQRGQIEDLRQVHVDSLKQKDRIIAGQQAEIERLQRDLKSRGDEGVELQKRIEELEKRFLAAQKGTADKILIEKKERRLTLISRGKALKTYKIALGGDPNGPKERQGDNKTPEGTYFIDSRNMDSRFHLSLHISYPNEKDRRRAKELGVSPGGDIMIHGIKKGLSWAGDRHAGVDWTNGCIAVTDEEIEEIERLTPNGAIVEIRP